VEAEGVGEAGPQLNREAHAGLDPRTPGSGPEPRKTLNRLSDPGPPQKVFYSPNFKIIPENK